MCVVFFFHSADFFYLSQLAIEDAEVHIPLVYMGAFVHWIYMENMAFIWRKHDDEAL